MKQGEIAAQLVLIEERLAAIEAAQIGRSIPAQHVATALADIEANYGLIGQLVEVAHAQREQIEALIHRLDTLIAQLTAHDARLVGYGDANERERHDLHELMAQLRELARKQVRSQEDLARAMGDGDRVWAGEERRSSLPDRRQK